MRQLSERIRAARERAGVARPAVLVAVLATVAIAYGVLTPWRRHLMQEAARYNRQAALNEANARRLAEERATADYARSAAARNPRDPEAHLVLARALSDIGDLPGAAKNAGKAADLSPHDTKALLFLADVKQRQRDLYAAMLAYRNVLARDPGNGPARAGLGLLDVSFGWPIEAEETLLPAVRSAPANPYLKVVLAMAYKQQENYSAAERLLIEARKLTPDDAGVWAPLAEIYSTMKRYREALGAAQQVLARQPHNGGALAIEGIAYDHLGDYPAAERVLKQAVAEAPTTLSTRSALALCYEHEGKRDDAIRELETVVRMAPGEADAERRLGALYMQSGRIPEGQRLLADSQRATAAALNQAHTGLVLAQKPRDPEAHYRMALVYRDAGNTGREVVELRRTLELNPHHAAAAKLLESVGPESHQ